MLSAVESFGPVSGPSVASGLPYAVAALHHSNHPHPLHHQQLQHQHQHQLPHQLPHHSYASAIAAAAAAAAAGGGGGGGSLNINTAGPPTTITPPITHPSGPPHLTITLPPPSSSHLEAFQQQQQHQHRQQQQQHQQPPQFSYYLLPPPPTTPTTPTAVTAPLALISPPLSSPSSAGSGSKRSFTNLSSPSSSRSPLNLGGGGFSGGFGGITEDHHPQQQQPQPQEQQRKSIMSISEFIRPHPKQPPPSSQSQSQSPSQSHSPSQSQSQSQPHSPHHHHATLSRQSLIAHEELKNGFAAHSRVGSYSSGLDQSTPMNLATTSNHSSSSQSQSQSQLIGNSRPERPPSSSSSSVDVENDGSMSPVSIPIVRKPQAIVTVSTASSSSAYDSAAAALHHQDAVAAAAAAYQLNYSQHLYASRAALYGAPVMFSGGPSHEAVLSQLSHSGPRALHTSYLNGITAEAGAFNAAYFKALSAAGVFQAQPPTTTAAAAAAAAMMATMATSKSNAMVSNRSISSGSILALAPPGPATVPTAQISSSTASSFISSTATTSPSLMSSLSTATSSNDLRHKSLSEAMTISHWAPPTPPTPTAPVPCAPAPIAVATPTATIVKLSSGTYLNDKVNSSPADTKANNYFKVPTGKEGSLKHRILHPRPAATSSSLSSATMAAPSAEKGGENGKAAFMRTHNTTANFKKGAYIELSNGQLRRVEDMRTEDFIQCAERSADHQLTEATVVRIDAKAKTVVITFSYDKNRSKADIDVSHEYPFFVYGQGWASCNPELSHRAFGLKCQRLQVGDICISLTQRDPAKSPATAASVAAANALPTSVEACVVGRQIHSHHHHHSTLGRIASLPNAGSEPPLLGRSNPSATLSPMTQVTASLNNIPMHLLPPPPPPPPPAAPLRHTYAPTSGLTIAASYTNGAPITRDGLQPPPAQPAAAAGTVVAAPIPMEGVNMHQPQSQSQHLSPKLAGGYYQHNQQQQQTQLYHHHSQIHYQAATTTTAVPLSPSAHSMRGDNGPVVKQLKNGFIENNNNNSNNNNNNCIDQDQPVDASMSRKRRWSAPEEISSDDNDTENQSSTRHPNMASNGGGSGNSGSGSSGDGAATSYKVFRTSTTPLGGT